MNAIAKWHMDEISKYEEDFRIGEMTDTMPQILQWHIQQIERITQWKMGTHYRVGIDMAKDNTDNLEDALEKLEEQHFDGAISWNTRIEEEERLTKEFIKAKKKEQEETTEQYNVFGERM